MIHLTPADYSRQPWKNGKGETVELARADRDGAMLWRLSMATVAEDGPFSLFPDIERNLTVLSGPGFRLTGAGVSLTCRPLHPVAFPGDVAVRAEGTGGQSSTDFNVMTARSMPRPRVTVERNAELAAGGRLALFALQAGVINGRPVGVHDLCMAESPASIAGLFMAVRLFGLPA